MKKFLSFPNHSLGLARGLAIMKEKLLSYCILMMGVHSTCCLMKFRKNDKEKKKNKEKNGYLDVGVADLKTYLTTRNKVLCTKQTNQKGILLLLFLFLT